MLTRVVTPIAGTSTDQKGPVMSRVKKPYPGAYLVQKGQVLTRVLTPESTQSQKGPVLTKVVFQNRSPNGPVLTKIDLPKTVQVQKVPNQLPVGQLKLIPVSNLPFQNRQNSPKVPIKIISADPPSSEDSSEDDEDWDLHSSLRVNAPPVKTTPVKTYHYNYFFFLSHSFSISVILNDAHTHKYTHALTFLSKAQNKNKKLRIKLPKADKSCTAPC